MSDEKKQYFDLNKTVQEHMCCLCECGDPAVHSCYWTCPIFENNTICSECCTIDTLRKGAEKKFSEKLGRPITREEINAMCRACGRNHATEDDALADGIQNNTLMPNFKPPVPPTPPDSTKG